jgi:hypothetical protein
MERNPNEGLNAQTGGQSGTAGTSGFGAAGAAGAAGGSGGQERYGSTGGASGLGGAGTAAGTYGSGATGGSMGSTIDESKVQKGKEAVAEKLGTARDKVGELKSTLADKLEAGAEKLRQRAHPGTGTYAGATGTGSVAVESDDRMAGATDKLARGMQSTATWIRDADLDSVKNDVERQVREHPGRTLLIAAGVGYLLGKAFRR